MKAPSKIVPPPAIVAERDRLIGQPYFEPEWQPILDKLCKAAAWKQLNMRSPVITRPQLIEWLGPVDEKWSDRDLALQAVFVKSFYLATLGTRTFTVAEIYERADPYRARANRLRAEAADLEDIGAADHVRAIERAAAFWDRAADDIEAAVGDDDTLIVKRHQAPPRVRGFCMQLAKAMRYIYGDVLRGTVASIATAALGHQVSAANVRFWCENKSS